MTKRFYPSPVRRAGSTGRTGHQRPDAYPGADPGASAWLDDFDIPDLQLEDEAARARTGSGYDPYDTIPNVRQPNSIQRQAELQQLSDWIRQKREAEKASDKESEAPGALPGLRWFWSGRRR